MLEPTPSHQRLDYLDLLRGIAILGILLLNIRHFAFPTAEAIDPGTVTSLSGLEQATLSIVQLLGEWKFMTLLAVLFGAGIWLFADRLEQKGQNPRPLHFRRCRWLLLFGLAHGFLIWHGDILAHYALAAMLVWPMRKLTVRRQAVVALALLVICYFLYYWLFSWIAGLSEEEVGQDMSFWTAEGGRREIAMVLGGGLEPLAFRASEYGEYLIGLLFAIWREIGLMLLGMVVARSGAAWLSARPKALPAITSAGLAVGLLLTGLSVMSGMQFSGSTKEYWVIDILYTYWGSIFMVVGYAGLIYYWLRSGVANGLKQRLQAVGRMALSLYLMQSLICTSLFYGHGFGLFGQLSHSQTFLVVLAIWALQLWLAPWWLARHRFGPAEHLWRHLTYRPKKGTESIKINQTG